MAPQGPTGPRRMTEEVKRRFVEGVREGLAMSWAARYAGISPATWNQWRFNAEQAIAKDETNEYTDLYYEVEKAQGDFVMSKMQQISGHANRSWMAAAWQLERRFPSDFGPRQVLEVSGPDGGPVVTVDERVLKDLSVEELLVLDSAMRKLKLTGAEGPTDGSNNDHSGGTSLDLVPTSARSYPTQAG